VYLYLDRLSNAFSGWGRAKNVHEEQLGPEHGVVKQAAE
jgi:HAE1 family hydrophobic/amphiphilic exporter-1